VSINDVRKLPLIREGDNALILADYADGYVSSGRTPDKCPRIVAKRVSLDGLCSALSRRGLTLSDFEHMGGSFDKLLTVEAPCHPVRIVSPWIAPPSFSTSLLEKMGDVPLGTAERDLEHFQSSSCLTVKATDLGTIVKLWLQDTGCAHDLVGKQEVQQIANSIRVHNCKL